MTFTSAPARWTSLLALSLLVTSCSIFGGKNEEGEPKLPPPPDDVKVETSGSILREPKEFQEGIGVYAWSYPGRLYISLRNKRDDDVILLNRDLAVIMSPDPREGLMVLDDESIVEERFKPIKVEPGQANWTILNFEDPELSVSGKRLVYNNPRQNVRFFVTID